MSANTSQKNKRAISEEELLRRSAELDARERELDKKERAQKAESKSGGLRRNLYEHVTLSVQTLNIIIVICAALIIALVLVGTLRGRAS
jgi:Flp pilus assembly protein TadB